MHPAARTLALLTFVPVLSACAWMPSFNSGQPGLQPAHLEEEQAPRIITAGFVQSIPVSTVATPNREVGPKLPKDKLAKAKAVKTPAQRVAAANTAALQEPATDAYVNAIQIYNYSNGALYRLYAAPQNVSDIALQPGENLTAISAGDTSRWVVGDTTSGNGPTKQVHVLAKPYAAGLKTNLVITTDRRSYHLELQSTPDVFMAAVSWTYPQDNIVKQLSSSTAAPAPSPMDGLAAVEDLHFGYEITGDNVLWKPVRAFDDGTHVFIEFPAALTKGDAPPLFISGPGGSNDLVNYRVRGSFYVVDQLFTQAELRFGQDRQEVVKIKRTYPLQTADISKPQAR